MALSRMLSSHHVRIGYLRLITFSEGSANELRAETRTVLNESAQGLILDLRGNGGGLINEAIDVASIFIQSGTTMSAVERRQPRRVYDARGDAIAAHIPLVVLVDHGRNLRGGGARQDADIAPNIYAPNDDGEALGVAERTVAA